jgi:dihydrofolate reductase
MNGTADPRMCTTASPTISLIYARSLNHCIGDNGEVPWCLPDDYTHFEKTTIGKPVIMGRRTYEDHKSALPGCLNIVVSTQQNYQAAEGIELLHSLPDAIDLANQNSKEIFVIGGVGLFNLAISKANTVYETVVDATISGDTVLPSYDFSRWNTELLQSHPIDKHHKFAFKIYRHHRQHLNPIDSA